MPSFEDIKKTAEAIQKIWNSDDKSGLGEHLSNDYVGVFPLSEGPLKGPGALVEFMGGWNHVMPDMKVEWQEIKKGFKPNQLLLGWKTTGTFKNAMGEIPPTNKPIALLGINVVTFDDNAKVLGEISLWDGMHVMGQLQGQFQVDPSTLEL